MVKKKKSSKLANEGTLSFKEAYQRGLLFAVVTIGSVFAIQLLQDLYRYWFHNNQTKI